MQTRSSCSSPNNLHATAQSWQWTLHLQPNYYEVEDCNHPDFDFWNIQLGSSAQYSVNLEISFCGSIDQNDFEQNRKLTGISKPLIFSGLKPYLMIPLPYCFSVDLMHLLCLNIGDLLVSLWRGSFKCDTLTDDKSTWGTICPELDKSANPQPPTYSHGTSGGYLLLRPRDRNAIKTNTEAQADAIEGAVNMERIRRWGCVQLPNGQIARSVHSESKRSGNRCISRNSVKVSETS